MVQRTRFALVLVAVMIAALVAMPTALATPSANFTGFTGNASIDFNNIKADGNTVIYFDDPQDIATSDPNVKIGYDLQRVYFFLDTTGQYGNADTLYVGLEVIDGAIYGDADGNGNPSTSGPPGVPGVQDFANLANTEFLSLIIDTNCNGTFDPRVGFDANGDLQLNAGHADLVIGEPGFSNSALGGTNLVQGTLGSVPLPANRGNFGVYELYKPVDATSPGSNFVNQQDSETDNPSRLDYTYPGTLAGPDFEFSVENYSGLFSGCTAPTVSANSMFIFNLTTGGESSDTVGEEVVTAIELASFTAALTDGAVTLTWETAAEYDNAGFNLYRSDAARGSYEKLNSTLIPAKGGRADVTSVYTYVDTPGTGAFSYVLEDVDLFGRHTQHPAIQIEVETGTETMQTRVYLPRVQD